MKYNLAIWSHWDHHAPPLLLPSFELSKPSHQFDQSARFKLTLFEWDANLRFAGQCLWLSWWSGRFWRQRTTVRIPSSVNYDRTFICSVSIVLKIKKRGREWPSKIFKLFKKCYPSWCKKQTLLENLHRDSWFLWPIFIELNNADSLVTSSALNPKVYFQCHHLWQEN